MYYMPHMPMYNFNYAKDVQESPLDLSKPKPAKRSRKRPTFETKDINTCSETNDVIVNVAAPLDLTRQQLPQTTIPILPKHSPNDVTTTTGSRMQVRLLDTEAWAEFGEVGTEMIINPPGRRMFPYVSVELRNLNPKTLYNVYIDVVPVDDKLYTYTGKKWSTTSPKEPLPKGMNHPFKHPDSPKPGRHWEVKGACFKQIKLTNRKKDGDTEAGRFCLRSMMKYVCCVFVEAFDNAVEGDVTTTDPLKRFDYVTLPETTFIAVTAYQNETITTMKIDTNPFARGFRDGKRSRTGCSRRNKPLMQHHPNQSAIDPTMIKNAFNIANPGVGNPALHNYPFMSPYGMTSFANYTQQVIANSLQHNVSSHTQHNTPPNMPHNMPHHNMPHFTNGTMPLPSSPSPVSMGSPSTSDSPISPSISKSSPIPFGSPIPNTSPISISSSPVPNNYNTSIHFNHQIPKSIPYPIGNPIPSSVNTTIPQNVMGNTSPNSINFGMTNTRINTTIPQNVTGNTSPNSNNFGMTNTRIPTPNDDQFAQQNFINPRASDSEPDNNSDFSDTDSDISDLRVNDSV